MINIYTELKLDALTEALELISQPAMYADEPRVSAPGWMIAAAKRGLKLRSAQPESNQCCLPVGLKRANQIINGEQLSQATLKRMKSFASRHGSQLLESSPEDSKLRQALLIWGIPDSKKGIQKFISWADSKIL
jgi:hypothetical protein